MNIFHTILIDLTFMCRFFSNNFREGCPLYYKDWDWLVDTDISKFKAPEDIMLAIVEESTHAVTACANHT